MKNIFFIFSLLVLASCGSRNVADRDDYDDDRRDRRDDYRRDDDDRDRDDRSPWWVP